MEVLGMEFLDRFVLFRLLLVIGYNYRHQGAVDDNEKWYHLYQITPA